MKITIEHKEEGSPIFARWILLKIDDEEIDCLDSFEVLENISKSLGIEIQSITFKPKKLT